MEAFASCLEIATPTVTLSHLKAPRASPVLGIGTGTYCAQHEVPHAYSPSHPWEEQQPKPPTQVTTTTTTMNLGAENHQAGSGGKKVTKEDVLVHQAAVKKNPRNYLRSIGVGRTAGVDVVEGEKRAEASHVAGPGGIPVQGSKYEVDHNHYRRHPRPCNYQQNYQDIQSRVKNEGSGRVLLKARANNACPTGPTSD
ncbi:hypothetical protein A6R68_17137 [Neotoma lepida]|uniref:Uncharacterized protein n=1 Tax=Neotoma lepida TaxID=56216 RepID=A0A1A6HDR1_NEOLE|nr:hypothetical protein A6R68_17137 [Neotoma lepida]